MSRDSIKIEIYYTYLANMLCIQTQKTPIFCSDNIDDGVVWDGGRAVPVGGMAPSFVGLILYMPAEIASS